MKLKFMSSTDSNEMRMLHTKCDSVVIMIDKDTYDIIQQLSDSLLNRYKKKGLEESIEGSGFVFDHVDGLQS